MNLLVYWEYVEPIYTNTENMQNALKRAQMGSSGQTTLNQKVSCKCTFKLVASTAGSSKPVSQLRNHSVVTWRRGWNPTAWAYRGAVCPPGGPWRGWWGAGTGWPPPGGTAAQRTGQARRTANQLGIKPNQGSLYPSKALFFPLPKWYFSPPTFRQYLFFMHNFAHFCPSCMNVSF